MTSTNPAHGNDQAVVLGAARHRHASPDPSPAVTNDDDLVTSWGLLSEAYVALTVRLADGLDAAGHLSLPQFDVLIRLLRQPGHTLPLRQIAAEIGLTAHGFAKLLNRMELDQLVVTEPTETDRATITVTITERGRDRTTTALTHHIDDLRQCLLDPLGAQGLRALDSLTRTLRDRNA